MTISKIRFSDVCEIQREIVNPNNIEKGEIYVGLEDIESNSGRILSYHSLEKSELKSSKFKFSNKHILYGKLRPYLNKVALPDRDGVCSTDILPLLPKEGKADKLFFAYMLRTSFFSQLATDRSIGANLPRLSPQELERFKIPLPQFGEQQRIGRLLRTIESTLEKRRQTIRLADEFLKSAFVEMFSDPEKNLKKFPVFAIGSECSVLGGKRLPKGEPFAQSKTDHPYLRVTDFQNFSIIEDNLKYIADDIFKKIERYTISKDDVYISIAGTIGLCGIVLDHLSGANLTENAAKLVIKDSNRLNKIYLVHYLGNNFVQQCIKQKTMSVGVPKLALFRIEELKLMLPPLWVQQEFADLVQKVEKLKEKQRQSETQLQNLFNSLMQRAFKGELKI